MNNQKTPDEVSLRILDEFSKDPAITQRALADRLGIALGLVNAYIKRLYKKGHLKIKSLPRNRIKYIITPKGFTEKARLTYGYMHRSIDYFRDTRRKIEMTYAQMITSGAKKTLLWGDGEIAELCYLSSRGLPIEIVGVVDGRRIENGFFGRHIYCADDLREIDYDSILVSSMDDETGEAIRQLNINPEMVYYL